MKNKQTPKTKNKTNKKPAKKISSNKITNPKCGFVAIFGAPNAGKSTLVNKITGEKVSIVTPRAQTTRNRIRGIKIYDNSQIILVDTPGIFKLTSKLDNNLNRSILKTAKNALEGIDCIVFLFDVAKKFNDDHAEVIDFISTSNLPKILVLNKIDLIDREKLLEIALNLNKLANFEQTFMISAEKGDGINDLLKFLSIKMPDGSFLYPKNEVTDFPARLVAAETTREKLFILLRQELPYNIMVETESYKETYNSIIIHQSIITTSEQHKGIIIGAKGAMLKKIGQQSRLELTKILGKNTQLYLHVKVRNDWMQNKQNLISSGIDL
jgi:GTP-binding protein Era